MNKKSQKLSAIAVSILVCLIAGLCVEPSVLQSGVCEDAFLTCMNDWYNQAWGYVGTVYCALGWAFCKKYVDPS